jgi:hypothetical protein
LNYASVGSTVSESERRPWGAFVGGLMVRLWQVSDLWH